MRKHIAISIMTVAAVLCCATATSFAQLPDRLTFHLGGGVSPVVGQASRRLDTGWHFDAGAGVKLTPTVETTLDYRYHGFGVTDLVLNEFQVPNAHARLWSLTVDPKVQIPINSKVKPYVIGGVGYYRRSVELTAPTIAQGLVFDPFFDAFFSVPFAAEQVLGTMRRSGIGGSLGGGFEVKVGSGDSTAKFFSEARYEYADTGRIPTRMVPVTFGIRW
jgi:opacity protein-like surface antigen